MKRRLRIALPLAAAFAIVSFSQERHIPEQPIPFSHKHHVGLALTCKDCHTNPDPGEVEGIPATSKCMACHFSIANDKPAIQKLKSYADQKQPVPWIRVYQIPSYVDFSHRTHLAAGFQMREVPRRGGDPRCVVERERYQHGWMHRLPQAKQGQHYLHVLSREPSIKSAKKTVCLPYSGQKYRGQFRKIQIIEAWNRLFGGSCAGYSSRARILPAPSKSYLSTIARRMCV